MSTITTDIVARLWNLCNILKDDGVTYHQYVTELTYLLFLKMAKETSTEDAIPAGHRWDDLEARSAPNRLEVYKLTLIHLGSHGSRLVQEIFANASSFISSGPPPRAHRGVSTEDFAGRRTGGDTQLCAHAGSLALVDDTAQWRAIGRDALAQRPYCPCAGPPNLAIELSRPRYTQGRGSARLRTIHHRQSTAGWAGRTDWRLPLVGFWLAGYSLVGLKPDLQFGSPSDSFLSLSLPPGGRALARQILLGILEDLNEEVEA